MSVEYAEDYYRRREQDQRLMAERASSKAIRELHLVMAQRYRELADEIHLLKRTEQGRDRPPSDDAAPSAWS